MCLSSQSVPHFPFPGRRCRLSTGTRCSRSHNCGCIFPHPLPWRGNPPSHPTPPPAPLTTSPPPGSSITPRWQGSPPEAWWREGPFLLHCGMQWGWQQCVGGRGPASRVWAGCYTVCRLLRSWGKYGAGMAGEFFSGPPWNGCPLSSPTARHSTLHLGSHLMDGPPALRVVLRRGVVMVETFTVSSHAVLKRLYLFIFPVTKSVAACPASLTSTAWKTKNESQ